MKYTKILRVVFGFCLFFISILAFDHKGFKTCEQSSFCRRNRYLADQRIPGDRYVFDESKLVLKEGILEATILKILETSKEIIHLPISISFLKTGAVRVKIDELQRRIGNISISDDAKIRKERYNETEKWTIVSNLECDKTVQNYKKKEGITIVNYGPGDVYEMIITHDPFKISFYKEKTLEILLNEYGYLNFEHWRPKPLVNEKSDYSDGFNMWEESFNGIHDSKPLGPESVALDITFVDYQHVYGIPEHSSSFSLKETRGENKDYNEPYRLYNTDVFEYESDSPASLYGSIPFMYAHKKNSSASIFWMNPSDTWIDIEKQKYNSEHSISLSTKSHWISETGLIDIFVFLSIDHNSIFKNYGELVGYTMLPNIFSLGYHQSRWNYLGEEDVFYVDNSFDEYDIPYDALWLDIEYSNGKAYFIWDNDYFPSPSKILERFNSKKRQLIVIVNPHIKKDEEYHAYKEIKDRELFIKTSKGDVYEANCWPGNSIWIDVISEEGAKWWSDKFQYEVLNFSFSNLHIWNDMNEPSVFNGPEYTIHKDAIHSGGWENRALHNLYGFVVQYYTYFGCTRKSNKKLRPFILSRSFWAGTSRIGAIWIGDNGSSWEHLRASIPEILSLNIAGLSFSGADVGGFFGNPSNELLTRWYQAGIFYPFFRGHSHINTRRREPWTIPSSYRSIIRNSILIRYQLLPTWYTAFFHASTTGLPVLRPQFLKFPDDENGFSIDDQFFLGDSGILVKPVTNEGATEINVYFGDDEPYYDYFDFSVHTGKGYKTFPCPLEKIPMFIQGGNIVIRRDRPRRSSLLMMNDPFTVIVALNNKGNAKGSLYLDDGVSFDNYDGFYIYKEFIFSSDNLTFVSYNLNNSKNSQEYSKKIKNIRIEKLIILKSDSIIKEITKGKAIQGKDTWEVEVTVTLSNDEKTQIISIRDPKLSITENWQLIL
ncbi:hypothetical protein T552_04095 [Pneumocystis carinii B80]|uniref:Glucosidase II subunit alpha n=1 Tax=Pneumocystis carinii (strain B80) TaxID=1408658 RepID=A0A0W4ZN21_PNEC8|nr:hypothetical protein T552_04095 [Pneumocystis carinii B80]KTW29775.1 hypothetical protein T552_04095 [Pneumocystis carinii B80]